MMNIIESLNIEYLRMKADTFEAKMNLTLFHTQTFGLLHGGTTLAFGETVAGNASNQIIGKDQMAMGQSIVANHLTAKKNEGYIIAKGKLMHQGKTTHVWGIEMVDENNVLISFLTVTNAIIAIRSQETGDRRKKSSERRQKPE